MRRIIVVGPPGSGKTTVSRELGAILGSPVVELDSHWWEPNWTEAGEERFRARLAPLLEGERWVVDGNYFSVGAREVAWPLADTIVWLDLPRWVTVPRVLFRTIRRGIRRTELWNGNRESIGMALRPDSIVLFALREHPKYNLRYAGLDGARGYEHLTWVRLPSPGAVRAWLSSLRAR